MTASRIGAFDGLRTVAIALVLVTHGARPATWPGGFGVDVFFVLSGFLITTILWQEHRDQSRIQLVPFYLKRAIRLYPALLAMLLISLAIGVLLTGDVRRMLFETASAALYLTPVTDVLVGPSLLYGHLWTLAMEEYFYLIWPVLLILLLKAGMRWKKTLVTMLLIAATVLYAIRAAAWIAIDSEIHPPRVGGIAIGCALALIALHTRKRGSATLFAVAGVIGLVLAWVTTGTQLDTVTPILAALGTVSLILSILAPKRTFLQRLLELRPMRWGGWISYDLYLWHVPLLLAGAAIVDLDRNRVWWWTYAIAIAVAAASYYAFAPLQRRLRASVNRRFSDRDDSTTITNSQGSH